MGSSIIKSLNPLAIDMESSALYQLGWLFNVPVIAIRGISNLLDTDGADENIDKSDVPLAAQNAAKCTLEMLK